MSYFLSFVLICLCAALSVNCSSAHKDFDHMTTKEYNTRPTLRQSLVNGSEPLSETAVQKILSSKISFPKQVSLAIVRLSETDDGLDFQTIDQDLSEKFYNKTNWGPRVQSIIPVPQVMLASPVTLIGLRQAAALLQADALLIIKPVSYGDWKFKWLEANKAKGITSLEILLLDTRTSVVPFTSLVTETAEISKDSSEYTNDELTSRAKKASEVKALLQVAPAVQKFFSKIR